MLSNLHKRRWHSPCFPWSHIWQWQWQQTTGGVISY